MSLKADAIQHFNDPSPYYVRENGKLRSLPGLGPSAKSRGLNQLIISPAYPTNGTDNTPRKLYDMTLDFVAANITLVESLVSFPEVVGQQLFDAAHRHGNLDLQTLGLFSDAYGGTILRSVNFQGGHLAVNEHLAHVAVFAYLSELEVGDCCIGDDHEILPMIANFNSLKRLGLSSNGLTDVGIQRVTAPLRVLGRGPRNLGILDLAGNPCISDKSASQYLTAFISLKAIDLSGCGMSSVGLDVLKARLGLKPNTSCALSAASSFHPPVKTVGWASPLVRQWLQSSTVVMQRAKCKASMDQTPGAAKATNFYGRARKRLENASTGILPRSRPPTLPIIQLIAATADHDQPTSNPRDKERIRRSKVTVSRRGQISKQGGKSALCFQGVEDLSTDADLTQSALDEDLIGQYARSVNDKFKDSEQIQKSQNRSKSATEAKMCEGNQLAIKQELVRVEKPPPKKRIKLCIRASKGFPDVLHDPVLDVGNVEPRSYRESSDGQQVSDGRRSRDENQMISQGQRFCLKQRQSAKCYARNRTQPDGPYSDKCTEQRNCKHRPKGGVVKNITNCEDCVCSDQMRTMKAGGTLWSAMHSEDWG